MKTWLVTGTSSGFGKELAKIIAESGDNLIATARKMSDLDYLNIYDQNHIEKVILDVTDTDKIKPSLTSAIEKMGKIDVLVNNAGIGYFSTIEESDMNQVRYMFDVNFFGLANVTNAVLPYFRKQGNGVIVNISSALALTTLPTMGFYSASKYAVEGYSDALRKEVAPLGIKVFVVEPSGARTNWSGKSSQKVIPRLLDYQNFKEMVEHTADGVTESAGDPKLIAKVIVELINSNEDLPSHLPLGNFAYEGGTDNLKQLLKMFEENEAISRSVDNK